MHTENSNDLRQAAHALPYTVFSWLTYGARQWWWRWQAHRQQVSLAVLDLRDRYGDAALMIARNSARARGGPEHKRFWLRVERQLRRG
jgi:hypothetical protein